MEKVCRVTEPPGMRRPDGEDYRRGEEAKKARKFRREDSRSQKVKARFGQELD